MLSDGGARWEEEFPAFEMMVGRNTNGKGTLACPF